MKWQSTIRSSSRTVLCRFNMPLGLLRGPFWPEVVVERHLAVDDGVLFPLRRPAGKRDLRFDDFLEQRICRRVLLHDVIEDLKLPFEDCIRRLVELHLVLGLQLDVVLRLASDRLPLHLLRTGVDRYWKDYIELQTKYKLKFYKTPDAILKR